jgi:hypothetical protein
MNKVAALLVTAFLLINQSAATERAPSRDSWITAAPMSQARLGHAMVELPAGPNALGLSTGPGKVMVIGGFDSQPLFAPNVPANPLDSCEIYDPATNTWTLAAPHPVAAGWRWAAVLKNGMVLVAGGALSTTSNVASSHLYDPRKNVWIATRPLPIGLANPHAFMRSIVLDDGRVLIAGGEDDKSVRGVIATGVLVHADNSYLFTLNERNPGLSFWDFTHRKSDRSISRMPEGRTTSALVLLDSGKVLNIGGLGPAFDGLEAATNTTSLFDPETGVWTKAAPMPPIIGLGEDEAITQYPTAPGSRWAPFSALLDNGRVLIAGGVGGVLFETLRASALLYDSRKNRWRITTPMHLAYGAGPWSAKLPDGTGVLFAGPGRSTTTFDLTAVTGEVFAPESSTWALVPAANGPPPDGSVDSFESQMLVLKNGKVQTTGGSDYSTDAFAINQSWIFTPKPSRR